jgi:hypothetical protein
MGLFDFFRKKGDNVRGVPFLVMEKYSDYLTYFKHIHSKENYAPIAAYEKSNGEITGTIILTDDTSRSLKAHEVSTILETDLTLKLDSGELLSFVVFYHSQLFAKAGEIVTDINNPVAREVDDMNAITVKYATIGSKGIIICRYQVYNSGPGYYSLSDMSADQSILIEKRGKLRSGPDLFKDIRYEDELTAAGIKVQRMDVGTHEHNWAAMVGFESFNNNHSVREELNEFQQMKDCNFGALVLRSVGGFTKFPVVKTDITLPVVNKIISESLYTGRLEAIIRGTAKDTFGILYQATDYAKNKELYRSSAALNIRLSAMAYVLDIASGDAAVGYIPNKDLKDFGCFDFIGKVINFKEVAFFDKNPQRGYIITTSLINDIFLIDVFVNSTSMRFQQLERGMRISGLIAMQGEIS